MRNGLSYGDASAKANAVAKIEYNKVVAGGGSVEDAQSAARRAYDAEMEWYED